ncbi:MAG: hypothetical protein R3F62_19295 [Planctomycetota bacterium]
MSPRRAFAGALLLALAGCAYLRDRGADAADVLTLQASYGLGLAADVKAGDALHLGVGYADVRKLGLRGREWRWIRDREVGLPLSSLLWIGALRDGQLSRVGHLYANVEELWFQAPTRWGELEVGAFVGVLGLRVGVSLIELVDLFAGLVGLDPLGDDRGLEPEPEALPEEPGEWLAGDLHDHCQPPDRAGHAASTPEETAELAATNGLDFVGINPHLWIGRRERASIGEFAPFARALRALAARDDLPLIVPGFEVTLARGIHELERSVAQIPGGHALLLFPEVEDLAQAVLKDPEATPLEAVRAWLDRPRTERLWAPTHPTHEAIEVPLFPDWAAHWPGVGRPPSPRVLRARAATALRDRPFPDAAPVSSLAPGGTLLSSGNAYADWLEVWTATDPEATTFSTAWAPAAAFEVAPQGEQPLVGLLEEPLDGLEALSGILQLAERAIGRGEDELATAQVFATLDRAILAERRRLTVLGGSDNHRDLLFPTLWVFARERSSAAVFEALRLGRVCVGGEGARWFRARTDLEPAWRWVGADLQAARQVELAWRGEAELFVDGVSQGSLRDSFVHDVEAGSFHAYRIVVGPSRSAWIYVNLPQEPQ